VPGPGPESTSAAARAAKATRRRKEREDMRKRLGENGRKEWRGRLGIWDRKWKIRRQIRRLTTAYPNSSLN
jgi:hypothetical protein